MNWWIQKEVDKYEGKSVLLKDGDRLRLDVPWTVKKVTWNDSEEVFKYYVEREDESAWVFETQLRLVGESKLSFMALQPLDILIQKKGESKHLKVVKVANVEHIVLEDGRQNEQFLKSESNLLDETYDMLCPAKQRQNLLLSDVTLHVGDVLMQSGWRTNELKVVRSVDEHGVWLENGDKTLFFAAEEMDRLHQGYLLVCKAKDRQDGRG